MPERRPVRPAVIVAVAAVSAFAAGLAGTATYLGVSWYLQERSSTAGPTALGETIPPETTVAARPCPQFTIDAVVAAGGPGNLVEVRYVQGARPSGLGGEAWICRDSDDTLYYQGHDRNGPATAATSGNTILLGGSFPGAVTRDGETYVATNGGTQYLVGPDTFAIVNNGNRQDFTNLDQRP